MDIIDQISMMKALSARCYLLLVEYASKQASNEA